MHSWQLYLQCCHPCAPPNPIPAPGFWFHTKALQGRTCGQGVAIADHKDWKCSEMAYGENVVHFKQNPMRNIRAENWSKTSQVSGILWITLNHLHFSSVSKIKALCFVCHGLYLPHVGDLWHSYLQSFQLGSQFLDQVFVPNFMNLILLHLLLGLILKAIQMIFLNNLLRAKHDHFSIYRGQNTIS